MRKTLFIALNDLRVYFSERGNLVGLVVLPITLTVMLGFISGGDNSPSRIRIDLIDLDQSDTSAQFISNLRQVNETLILCPSDSDSDNCDLGDNDTLSVEQSIERVQNVDTRALIVIPQGYSDNLQTAQAIAIDYYARTDGSGGFNDPVLASLQTVIQRTNAAIHASNVGTDAIANLIVNDEPISIFSDEAEQVTFAEALRIEAETMLSQQSDSVNFVLTSGDSEAGNLGTGFGQAVPGQGATFVMFTVLGGMAILMRERREWTLQRLIVLPLSRAQVLGGKILAFVALGMIQFAVVFAVGLITGTDFGNAPLAILLLMLAFVLATTALAFAVATRLKNEEQAGGLALLISFTLAPLGGAWWPLDITPSFMQTIGHFTPTAWVMDGFQDIIFFGGGLVDVLPEIGVLLLIAAAFFAIGIRGFQYE
ncbi:MAG: ABC transporter permease [Anaerolineae bacterium]|nr:ABC transporter permease [Anaerolineae bacterium]